MRHYITYVALIMPSIWFDVSLIFLYLVSQVGCRFIYDPPIFGSMLVDDGK